MIPTLEHDRSCGPHRGGNGADHADHAAPFMPGSYDPLAASLSMMARLFGFAGLLLVPIGILWTASSYWRRASRREYACAMAAVIVWSIISGALSVSALALHSPERLARARLLCGSCGAAGALEVFLVRLRSGGCYCAGRAKAMSS
jgi:hypothetical protein